MRQVLGFYRGMTKSRKDQIPTQLYYANAMFYVVNDYFNVVNEIQQVDKDDNYAIRHF